VVFFGGKFGCPKNGLIAPLTAGFWAAKPLYMLRKLYNWTLNLAGEPYALWALGLVAFIESSFFPIPPDVLLIPMALSKPYKAYFMAAIATGSSVMGGILGYAIGYYFFNGYGQPLLDFYGYGDKFETFTGWYDEWGLLVVFGAGLTPFPYKVITIASGVAAFDPIIFILSSIVARGLRFFAVAALLKRFGEPIRVFIDKWLGQLTIAFVVLLVGGFVLLKYLA
jgi:membrane protein YqaA with SNARE-associated domain